MKNSEKTLRAGGRLIGAISLLTAIGYAGVVTGCTSAPPRPLLPDDGAAKFSSLVEFKVDSSGREHVVEITAPTPGYQAKVVYIGEAYKEREVYLLIREPDPLYVYSAALVKQKISTGVDATMPIRLLAEQISFSARPEAELYQDVMRVPGRAPNPGKTAAPSAPAATPKTEPTTK